MDDLEQAAEPVAAHEDIRATVAAAFKTHNEPEPQNAEPAAAPSDTPEVEKPERARNERGQFIKADGSVDPDQSPNPIPDADPAREQQEAQPSPAAFQPPTSWSADAKAHWATLPPALQQAVAKRESEMSEGQRRWSEREQRYDSMLAPVAEAASRTGITVEEGLNRLIGANAMLEQNPVQGLVEIGRFYGIDLAPFFQSNPQQQRAMPAVDPTIQHLMQTVNSMQTTLQTREQAEANASIEAFAKSPGHEHFDTVRGQMSTLLEKGLATDLQSAYDMAVWSSPEVRAQLIAAQTAPVAARQQQQVQVDKAKRGALSLNGSPAGVPAPAAKEFDNVRDAVKDAYRQHAGSAHV